MAVQTHVPDRVRELRAAGFSPKQIAKTLHLRPAVAARLVRMLAAEDAADAPEPAVVGCWVSPVGFQNSAVVLDLWFQAARSYSLISPPRTGRRLIRWQWSRAG